MFLVSLSFMVVMFSFSPLKLSLFLSFISVLLAGVSYYITGSVYLSSALVISFSSGMMILFSYCAMVSNFESKSKYFLFEMGSFTLFSVCFSLFLSAYPEMISCPQSFSQLMILESVALFFMMVVVIVTMFGMNKTYFNPTKKFMDSY